MSTICPNCLRPIRAGANYCGFCGSSLTINNGGNGLTLSSAQEQTAPGGESDTAPLPGPTYDTTGRTVSTIGIILLILVIIAGFAMRYWADITTWLGQILGMNFK